MSRHPLARVLLSTTMSAIILASGSALAQPRGDWHDEHHDAMAHEEHHDAAMHEEHHEAVVQAVRDHNEHRHPPEVVVHVDTAPRYRGPRYLPEPVVYYHDRRPHYYVSHYYTNMYIPVEPAVPYVEVRCGAQPITGTIVGGVAGGLIGNQFGHGRFRAMNTIGGAMLGAVIGRSIDQMDESCAYQALEYAQPNTQVVWANPQNNYSYTVTPGPITNQGNGQYCREYQASIMVGGQVQNGYGQACRQPDGSWQTVN